MRRIAVQIGLSYLALTALTVGIGGVAAGLLADLGGAVGRTLDENVQSVVAAERMGRALDAQETARADRDAATFRAAASTFRSALADARAAAFLPEEPALIDSIRTVHAAYVGAWEDGPAASGWADRLDALGGRLLLLNERAASERAQQTASAATAARQSLLIAVVCAVAASVVAGVYFARRISRPLRDLTARVVEVGPGQFDRRVDERGGGEVGALARAFNEMGARLQAHEAVNVQALLREKRTAESLVEAIPSPVVVTDGDRVRLLNEAAARLFPDGAGAVLGRPLDEAAPALAPPPAGEGAPPDGPLVEVDGPGGPRTYRLRRTVAEVPHPEAADRLTITLLEDVTPFRALDEARREFFAAVSHELRTPLTSAGMAADLLLRETTGPLSEEQAELAELIKGDVGRMRDLVARLLVLARVEAGGRASGPVDLGSVVAEAVAGVGLVAADAGVDVVVEVPPGLPPIDGDGGALAMAASNLVANAVRHARSRVTVRVEPEGDPPRRLRLSVLDDGPGLPPGAEDRVFEPLVQLGVADGAQGRPGSAGLGLTIVRRVAEAHGGRAWATPGPGGRFTLSLPVAGSDA